MKKLSFLIVVIVLLMAISGNAQTYKWKYFDSTNLTYTTYLDTLSGTTSYLPASTGVDTYPSSLKAQYTEGWLVVDVVTVSDSLQIYPQITYTADATFSYPMPWGCYVNGDDDVLTTRQNITAAGRYIFHYYGSPDVVRYKITHTASDVISWQLWLENPAGAMIPSRR